MAARIENDTYNRLCDYAVGARFDELNRFYRRMPTLGLEEIGLSYCRVQVWRRYLMLQAELQGDLAGRDLAERTPDEVIQEVVTDLLAPIGLSL